MTISEIAGVVLSAYGVGLAIGLLVGAFLSIFSGLSQH